MVKGVILVDLTDQGRGAIKDLLKDGRKRFSANGIVFYILVAPLLVAGCSMASKPETPIPQQKAEASAKPPAEALVSKPLAQSSLDQLRKGVVTPTPTSSPLKDIYFDFDRYDLRADARDTLKANADWLQANPSATVQIEGHCDERGTTEYNLALGAKRAHAALDYIVTLGIAPARLSTISYGKELPVCQEHNEECWQKNRHDRFVMQATPTS